MRARTAIIVVVLAVTAVAAVPVAGLAATGDPVAADQHTNSTENANENASVAPGERLAGVVGVQEAELEGEVDGRAFGLRVASAASDDARADVVGGQFDDIEKRLDELEQRKQSLDEARENGSMSEGKYRAEVAELAARTETVKDLANRSENATQGLPAELLESKGINVDAIQTLKDRAGNMTGPEVAEIARSIAGAGASPVDRGPPADSPGQDGPPEDRPSQVGNTDGDADTPTATPADGSDRGQQDGADSGQQDDTSGDSDTATATPTPDDGGDGNDRSDTDDGNDRSDGGAGGY